MNFADLSELQLPHSFPTLPDQLLAPIPEKSPHQALFEAGNQFHLEGKHHEALQAFVKILRDEPNYPNVWVHAGNVARTMGNDQAALHFYAHAEALAKKESPEWPAIQHNLAQALRNAGHFERALVYARKAAGAVYFDKMYSMSLHHSLLQLEQFEQGWLVYRAREIRKKVTPGRHAQSWGGQQVSVEQPVLVWNEQGLGEQIMFSSMLPEAKERAPKLVVLADPRLLPVWRRSFPGIDFQVNVDINASWMHTSICDLGGFFRNSLAAFPKHSGYLKADPLRSAVLRARYAGGPGTRTVGVSWRTTKSQVSDEKSFGLDDLAGILRTPDCNFVSLQYGNVSADKAKAAEMGLNLMFDPDVDVDASMEDAFAQVEATDLVITNSSTVAHIAGSLGKPVWVVLPYAKGLLWHWFVRREDSPWYPSARLFRATAGERGWDGVLGRVKAALDGGGSPA